MYEDGVVREIYKVLGDSEKDFKSFHNLSLHFRGIDVATVEEHEKRVLSWFNEPTSSSSQSFESSYAMSQEQTLVESEDRSMDCREREVEIDSFELTSPNPATELGIRLSEVATAKVLLLSICGSMLYIIF